MTKKQKKLPASVLVFTLVLISASLILSLALFKIDTAIIRGRFLEYKRIKREMIRGTLINSTINDIYTGRLDLQKDHKYKRTIDNVDYTLEIESTDKHVKTIRAKSIYNESERTIKTIPVTHYFQVYNKEKSLSLSSSQKELTGPIYAGKLNISVGDIKGRISSWHKNDLPVISASDLSVNISDQAGSLYLSKTDLSEKNPVKIYQEEKVDPEDLTANILLQTGISLDTSKIIYTKTSTLNIKKGKIKEIVNPYLNLKDYLFRMSHTSYYTDQRLRKYNNKANLYIIPPSKYQQDEPIDPYSYADSISAEKSYIHSDNAITFHPEEYVYTIKPSREMLSRKNEIRLFTRSSSHISAYRDLKDVSINGKTVNYTYDRAERLIKLDRTDYTKFLFRSDGRKDSYKLQVRPEIVYVNGVMTGFSYSDGKVHFNTNPPYGAVVEYIHKLPELKIRKKSIPSSWHVLVDTIVNTIEVDLSRFNYSKYDSISSDLPLYLSGQALDSLVIESSDDIYIGETSNKKDVLYLSARLIFLDNTKKEYSIENMSLNTLADCILPLHDGKSAIKGNLVLNQELKQYHSGSEDANIFSTFGNSSSVEWTYPKGFIKNQGNSYFLLIN